MEYYFMQDIVNVGAVATENDALSLLLGSRKISKITTFCPLSPAPFIGILPNIQRCKLYT